MDKENKIYTDIPKEKFTFASSADNLHDKKLETKPVGYFKDALNRFRKNKASIVASIILLILFLFALIGPYCFSRSYQNLYVSDVDLQLYQYLTPKLSFMEGSGIWDGSKKETVNQLKYYKYKAMAQETGHNPISKIYDEYDVNGTKMYDIRTNRYFTLGVITKTLTEEDYKKIQNWQNENGIQVLLPYVQYDSIPGVYESTVLVKGDNNYWFQCDANGKPVLDENGNFIDGYYRKGIDDYFSLRLDGDPGKVELENPEDVKNITNRYRYAKKAVSSIRDENGNKRYNYIVRIDAYNYFIYKYGFEPSFAFGTDSHGYDIFSRLASGARFSLLFAIAVSAINLVIGAIYGAIEGYYGGATDMIMERISDILSAVPSMVVTVLFNLHLSKTVGTIPSLLYAFIVTGWIGMASRTRMQFYRFKNQEYVLAARTLGAKDWRIMFKHIFPNSLGTLITGSVLVIPGVIFSETSLTYLGIINLDSPTRSSVGAMLSAGKDVMTKYPHVIFFPALFIALLMICFNLFGNGLRDAFNPSLRGTED